MSYRQNQAALMPTALQSAYGQSLARAMGIVKDWAAQQARGGVLQRFPQYAAPDALGALGSERKLDQGVDAERVAVLGANETSAAFASRVRDAWNQWQLGGTAWGVLTALGQQGYFPQLVCMSGLIYSVDHSFNLSITVGPPLTFTVNLWNTFFLWFATPPTTWTSISSPPTTSSAPTIYEVRKLRRLVNRWKRAVDFFIGFGVLTSGTPGIWGAPGSDWGTGTWDSATVYWFAPNDFAQWTVPPGQTWGQAGLTWGAQV